MSIGRATISYVESVVRSVLCDVGVGETFTRAELDLMYDTVCPYYYANMKEIKTIISTFLIRLANMRSIQRVDNAKEIQLRRYKKIGKIRKSPSFISNDLAGGSPPKEKTRDYIVRLIGNIIGEMKLMSRFDRKKLDNLIDGKDPYYTPCQIDHHVKLALRLFDRLGYIRSIAGTGQVGNPKQYIVTKQVPDVQENVTWDLGDIPN